MTLAGSYWIVRGDTLEDAIAHVEEFTHEELVHLVMNSRLNSFLSDRSDYSKDEEDPHSHGKKIPYLGWFWRSVDFMSGSVPIGDCGDFIGFMENNKWYHPERLLDSDELHDVLTLIWKAKKASEAGGLSTEINKNTDDALTELWDLFQTFRGKGDWQS